ncbi:MAG: SMP-30/gluconolactonase/LRE family protein [Dermatophilaceae bacterium]
MDARVVVDGLGFPESPRWHLGRLYFSDWAAGRVYVLAPDGTADVVAVGTAFPLCIDFLPDGRLVVVHGSELRVQQGDELVEYADLSHLSPYAFNDITVHPSGTVYVNCVGFDFLGGQDPRPGIVVAVTDAGRARQVVGDVLFPNGMAITEGSLLVAESYRQRITAFDISDDGGVGAARTWAQTPGHHPDGICLAPDGTLWYSDVGTTRCVNIAEGGTIRREVQLDRGAFACALGEGVLYVTTNTWDGGVDPNGGHGQLVAVEL